MGLSATEVERICMNCLFLEEELDKQGNPTTPPIVVEGITTSYGFHPGRVEKHKAQIVELLNMLPPKAWEGCSFLELCMDKHGNLWGQHRSVEQLMCLGMALQLVTCLMTRDIWAALPGGVPYYQVKEDK